MTTPSSTPSPSRGSKLSQRLGRLFLLAVLLVGVLGGWQLYQISWATKTFQVQLRPEDNVYGEMLRTVLQPEDLLQSMRLELRLRDGTSLAELPPGTADGTLVAKGRAARVAVEKGQLDAELTYPGSESGRLTITSLELEAKADTLHVILPRSAASAFLEGDVRGSFAIRTPEGDALPDVVDVGGFLETSSREPGVYHLPLSADELLMMLSRGQQTYALTAQAGDARVQLEVPLSWFLGQGENHVLTVERIVSDVAEVFPVVESFSPSRAVVDRWNGQLTLQGRDLDLVESVWLDGSGGRREAPVVSRRIDGLVADAGTLPAGTYRIGIGWKSEQQVLSGRLTVAAGFALVSPAQGAAVVRGDDVPIRWQSPAGAGEVVVEATDDPGAGAWLQIYRGDAAAGGCTWTTESFTAADQGTLHLRVSWPEQATVAPIERTVELVAPAKISVRLRFRLEGREYGMIQSVRIDGEPVSIGADPVIVPVSVEPGHHRIQAEAPLLDPYAGTFEATHEGQIIDIDLR